MNEPTPLDQATVRFTIVVIGIVVVMVTIIICASVLMMNGIGI